jgi:hypothetical protein
VAGATGVGFLRPTDNAPAHYAVGFECANLLDDALGDLDEDPASIVDHPPRKLVATPAKPAAIDVLRNISSRLGTVLAQLARQSHGGKPGFVVKDEHDVQHVLGALLRLYFDDVRPEEPTPTYAGGSSKIDYLLANESTAVEVKHTRETLRDRQVGEELIDDTARYRQHANCKALFCLVYDPGRLLVNPQGLQNDLTGHRDGLEVVVVVTH